MALDLRKYLPPPAFAHPVAQHSLPANTKSASARKICAHPQAPSALTLRSHPSHSEHFQKFYAAKATSLLPTVNWITSSVAYTPTVAHLHSGIAKAISANFHKPLQPHPGIYEQKNSLFSVLSIFSKLMKAGLCAPPANPTVRFTPAHKNFVKH